VSGGGKPFGPTPRSYAQAMPRRARREALRAALAAKIAADELTVIERLDLREPKTKALVTRLAGLGLPPAPTLVIVSGREEGLARAARNVPWLTVQTPSHTSVYQLLRHRQVVFERAALLALQEALAQ